MKVGSLCTGMGGIEMALEDVFGSVELMFTADIDKGSSKILAYRYPSAPNLGDITLVRWKEDNIPRVDILTAGFPCTDVSGAGRREGLKKHTRTGLWYEVRRAIDELCPPFVLVENVLGLLSAETDSLVEYCPECMGADPAGPEHILRALPVVLADLAALGYDARWTVVRASDIGPPHRRDRIFVLAADTRGEGFQGLSRQVRADQARHDAGIP